MNNDYILKRIQPYVASGKLTYNDFGKIFGTLPLKEQYPICYAIQDDLHIEIVDELDAARAKSVGFALRAFGRARTHP